MRFYAVTLFVLFALRVRAATIPSHALPVPELEKKLSEAANEVLDKNADPLESVTNDQELIDEANIKEIDNRVRNRIKIVDAVPVKVVVENKPESWKGNIEKGIEGALENSEDDIKRVEIDLDNPGAPQHQEHETQNPEHHEDELQAVTAIKQTIKDTQDVFEQGLQGITEGIQGWFSNNEQISSIQQNIQGLQASFSNQITKLNETIQGFLRSDTVHSNQPVEETQKQGVAQNVESGLKVLEHNFETGVKSLADGVDILASLKADNESSSNSPGGAGSGPFASIAQYLQNFQNTLVQGFNNVTNTLQNYVNQNQHASTIAPNAQADEGATTKPTIWQGIQSSIQNILSPGQTQGSQASPTSQQSLGNGPIAQAIQNNPFVQGVVNFIQPNKPPASSNQASTEAVTAAASSDNVPADEVKPQTGDLQQKQKPEQQTIAPQGGPIQQIIQKNPIVQGIAGAVQRIQHLGNPEKPREANEKSEEINDDTQGHLKFGEHYGGYHGGHHGGGSQSGDNNDFGSGGVTLKSDEIKSESATTANEDHKKVDVEKQTNPQVVPVKTE